MFGMCVWLVRRLIGAEARVRGKQEARDPADDWLPASKREEGGDTEEENKWLNETFTGLFRSGFNNLHV